MSKQRKLYTRKRLNALLAGMEEYPITVLVASTGYGKTTAVRQYLSKTKTSSLYISITSADEKVFWQKLCAAAETVAPQAARDISLIGIPTDDLKISRIIAILRDQLDQPLILVLDDCQLLPRGSMIFTLITTIIMEEFPNLHLVLLSQIVPPIKLHTLVFKDYCLLLKRSDLAFTVEETSGYMEMRGIRLAETAVEEIHTKSGGWISILYFISEALRHCQMDYRLQSLNQMFEENFLLFFTWEERDMLVRLSVLDGFTEDLAVAATGNQHISRILSQLERENAFIVRNDQGVYFFHALLKNYLNSQCVEDEEQKFLYFRAGRWYLLHKEYVKALDYYWKSGKIELFLETVDAQEQQWFKFCHKQLQMITPTLDEVLWTRYPVAFLQISFSLLISGKQLYANLGYRIIKTLEVWCEQCSDPRRNRILGDCILTLTIFGLNEDDDWNRHYCQAQEIFNGESSLVLQRTDPITFGMPLFVCLEYRKPGTLDWIVEQDMCCPLEKMVPGFGHGMDKIIQAEAALLRCQMDRAYQFAWQAIIASREEQQYFFEMCAEFTLLCTFLFDGNYIEAVNQLEAMRKTATISMQNQGMVRQDVYRKTIELSEGFLYTAVGQVDKIPPVFFEYTGDNNPFMYGMGLYNLLRGRTAYLMGDVAIAASECERILNLRHQNVHQSQLIRLFALVQQSLAEKKLLNDELSRKLLVTAVQEAAMDGVVLPFVERPSEVLPLLIDVRSQLQDQALIFLKEVIKCCQRQKSIPMNWYVPNSDKSITPRELETLKLVAKGLTHKQIADEMQIKAVTVKKHLISVYAKLGVSNKVSAIQMARAQKLI